MKSCITLLLGVSLAAGSLAAQQPEAPDAAARRTALKKLGFIVGDWTGDATATTGPGQQLRIRHTEVVRSKLKGLVLVVEGMGRLLTASGVGDTVFNTLATIEWNAQRGYVMQSRTLEGRSGEFPLEVSDSGLVWGMDVPGGRVRNTMRLTNSGEWHEIGEFLRDGAAPMRMVEMRLRRTGAVAPAQDGGLTRLEREIGRLAPLSGGKLGVGVIHLETGRELFVNRNEPFPMASTYKVPIATELLRRVDAGQFGLDSMITLAPSDLHPGSGTLTQLFNDPGVSLSVRNLLELMLLISDNSATDIMLRTAGGGAAVNSRLAALGVSGISVDRPTVVLIADAVGIRNLPPENERTPQRFGALARAVTTEQRKAARDAFYQDRRDTSTPEGMARLLEKVWRRQALSPKNTDLLLDIMLRCETGAARIKGLLPPGVPVMHKTGTLSLGVTNDVGIIRLPGDAGHVILTVFVKESTADAASQERVIAQVARAVYDYFVFNPGKD